jgi:hypothetical protein
LEKLLDDAVVFIFGEIGDDVPVLLAEGVYPAPG